MRTFQKTSSIVKPMTMIRRILMLILGYMYVPKLMQAVRGDFNINPIDNHYALLFWFFTIAVIYFILRKD